MQVFQKIWKDIRQGENIDLYLSVITAFSIIILGLLGVNTSTLLAPLTLTVLGLLAISMLVNRERVEELSHKIGKPLEPFFLRELPQSFPGEFEAAKEVWLIGISYSRTIKTHYSLIERKLKVGHAIKVLLIHPEGSSLEIAAQRMYKPTSTEQKQAEILNSLQSLCQLRTVTPGKLEIRTIKHALGFGIRAINPEAKSGIIYIEHYPYKYDSAEPKFVLRARDGYWYDQFKQDAMRLWDNGVEWECK